MPAVSQKQRRLMGLALHHPEKVRPENRSVLSMKESDMRDFASTPEKNLPGAHQAFRSPKPPHPESKIKTAMRQMMRKNGDARGGSKPGRNRD
jgi:hypothetical protein